MPNQVEFQKYFGDFNLEEVGGIANRWLALPTYMQLPDAEIQRAESLVELSGSVQAFTEHHRQAIRPLTKSNRHFEALDLVDERLTTLERGFTGDELITARVFAYRRRGFVQEDLATFGDYSILELGHPMRTTAFLSAARDYMLADLKLGCVTDFGMRVAECAGGARVEELRTAALTKLFGNAQSITLVNANDGGAMAIVGDLLRRAVTRIDMGKNPGGGHTQVIAVKQPDPRIN